MSFRLHQITYEIQWAQMQHKLSMLTIFWMLYPFCMNTLHFHSTFACIIKYQYYKVKPTHGTQDRCLKFNCISSLWVGSSIAVKMIVNYREMRNWSIYIYVWYVRQNPFFSLFNLNIRRKFNWTTTWLNDRLDIRFASCCRYCYLLLSSSSSLSSFAPPNSNTINSEVEIEL